MHFAIFQVINLMLILMHSITYCSLSPMKRKTGIVPGYPCEKTVNSIYDVYLPWNFISFSLGNKTSSLLEATSNNISLFFLFSNLILLMVSLLLKLQIMSIGYCVGTGG